MQVVCLENRVVVIIVGLVLEPVPEAIAAAAVVGEVGVILGLRLLLRCYYYCCYYYYCYYYYCYYYFCYLLVRVLSRYLESAAALEISSACTLDSKTNCARAAAAEANPAEIPARPDAVGPVINRVPWSRVELRDTCTHTHTRTHLHTYTVCVCVCACVCLCARACVCLCVCVCVCTSAQPLTIITVYHACDKR